MSIEQPFSDPPQKAPDIRIRVRAPKPAEPQSAQSTDAKPEQAAAPEAIVKRPRGRPRKHPLPSEPPERRDYEIGYGKPPRAHQFKAGNNANPGGRPKGALSMRTIVERTMSEKITAKIGGKLVRMTKGEALMQRLMERGINGDLGAARALLQMAQKLEQPPGLDDAVEADKPLSIEEQAMMARFLARKTEEWSRDAQP